MILPFLCSLHLSCEFSYLRPISGCCCSIVNTISHVLSAEITIRLFWSTCPTWSNRGDTGSKILYENWCKFLAPNRKQLCSAQEFMHMAKIVRFIGWLDGWLCFQLASTIVFIVIVHVQFSCTKNVRELVSYF